MPEEVQGPDCTMDGQKVPNENIDFSSWFWQRCEDAGCRVDGLLEMIGFRFVSLVSAC